MHRLVPEFILEQDQAQCYFGEFTAVGMFLDISGFSAMTDSLMRHGQHGAEVLASLMRSVFDPLLQAIYQQGGMVVGIAGDSISALFPFEMAGSQAPLRALASAWAIQQHLAENPEYRTDYGVFKISAKIGLDCGPVKWGILQSRTGQKATYYFRGSAVDESAQAEKRARAGEILFSAEFLHQVGDGAQVEAREAFFQLLTISADLPLALPISRPAFPEAAVRKFIPHELILQGVQSEFRPSVILFMAFPDLPDADLREFMSSFFDLQEVYGGLIDHLDFGDKGCNLVILWGAPVAYENDVDRATNFIIELQARVSFLLRAGLTYYISRSGYIGSELFEVYTCYGWGINLAARFMMSASNGQVRLDERVAQRIQSHFEIEFIGEQVFKGFAQPQKVSALGVRKPETEVIFGGEMLGRETELEQLAAFVQPLWAGDFAGTAIIWGEAGIGKSRLVYEFQNSQALAGHSVLWAFCQADQIFRQSFNPFRYWLKAYFGLTGSDAERDKKQFEGRFQRLVETVPNPEILAELRRLKSVLGALVNLFEVDSLYEQLDAEGRYENTQLALIALLKAESLLRPVILFIEDAHYLDDDSKAFFRYLKRALLAEASAYPLAILATSRREGAALPLDLDFADLEIDLSGLSQQALDELTTSILGHRVAPEVVKLVFERSDGNPFFAEQVLRYLREEGLLTSAGSLKQLGQERQMIVIPTDINAILIARLDQLSQTVREIVQTASVLGREFETQILARMMKNETGMSTEIADAEKSAIWAPMSQIRYIFRHALLRDTAYSMQMQARRRELHALALGALEQLYAGELKPHYGELAYHSEQGGLLEKAQVYLRLAGDLAREAYQNSQALDYYERALKVLPETALAERYDLCLNRETLLAFMGEKDEQAHELERLSGIAQQMDEPEKTAEVIYRQADYQATLGNYQLAIEIAWQALAILETSAPAHISGLIHRVLAESFYRQGKYAEAIEESARALALLRQLDQPHSEADCLNLLGMIEIENNDFAQAKTYFAQSLEIFAEISHVRGQARVLNNLGMLASMQGDFEAAQADYEKALALARETGQRKGEGLLLGNLGWIAGLQGDFACALSYGIRNLQVARETGDRYTETIGLVNLSGHAGALGDFSAAVAYARQALELARQSNDLNAQGWALTYLGHGLFDQGEIEPAREAYQAAVQIREELNQPVLASEPGAGLARIALTKGDLASAQTSVEGILSLLGAGGSLDGTDQPLRVYHVCYLVLTAAQDARAREILQVAIELLNVRAASITDAAAHQMFLENIPYHSELVTAWQQS
jgi:predicted ATPase/class 3 adenylate cyclase